MGYKTNPHITHAKSCADCSIVECRHTCAVTTDVQSPSSGVAAHITACHMCVSVFSVAEWAALQLPHLLQVSLLPSAAKSCCALWNLTSFLEEVSHKKRPAQRCKTCRCHQYYIMHAATQSVNLPGGCAKQPRVYTQSYAH